MQIASLKVKAWDERRDLLIPGDQNATINLCVRHFIMTCRSAIQDHANFYVALSGGSTPKTIYQYLCTPPFSEQIDWTKVWLFWGDERAVPPDHPDSNFHMAMEAGFKRMPIPKEHIHRMHAEEQLEKNALAYEKKIQEILKGRGFDLMILGMGEDGHTASLFPQTEALHIQNRLVVANFIPQKNAWRMTATYDCINQANQIVIYVFGASKKYILKEIFNSTEQFDRFPIQQVGTKEHKALWIIDEAAASELLK